MMMIDALVKISKGAVTYRTLRIWKWGDKHHYSLWVNFTSLPLPIILMFTQIAPKFLTLTPKRWFNYRGERSERIIQVPGCDDCTGLGHDQNLVSVPSRRLAQVFPRFLLIREAFCINKKDV